MFRLQNSKKIIVLLPLILSFVFFNFCNAATLYLEPQNQTVKFGDVFIQEIRIDAEEPINTVEVNLKYPNEILEVVDISLGNSILTIMAQEPVIDQESGLISFAGGIPGGYDKIIPNGAGESNLIARVIFQCCDKSKADFSICASLSDIPSEIQRKITIQDSSKILLNDGFGTEDDIETKESVINIVPESPEIVEDEWQKQKQADIFPPEQIQAEIIYDTLMEGQHVLVFSAVDKQTGIDYYEVKEGIRDWQRAESPYLLVDQVLKCLIKVKAVDKAGNERIEIVSIGLTLYCLLGLLLIIIIIVIYLIVLRKRKRRKHDNL